MTRRHLYYLLYIFFLFLLESAGRKVLVQDFYFVPALLLLVSIAAAIRKSLPEALWLSFFAGFLLEIFSGLGFGSYIFALSLTSALIFFMTRKVAAQDVSAFSSAVLVVLGTALFVFGIFAYNGFFSLLGLGKVPVLQSLLGSKMLWTLALNVIAFYPVKFVFDILPKRE